MSEPETSEKPKVVTYPLRIPVELREWLAKESEKNQRSINGEIVFRLQGQMNGAQA